MAITMIDIECDNCKNKFKKIKSDVGKNKHHFCSKKCEKEFKHNLHFEIRTCPICGNTFECSKKSSKKLCSRKCQGKWQSTQTGINNPRFKQIEIQCDWCKKKFYAKKYKVESSQKNFCSKECRKEWFAKDYSQRDDVKIASRKRAISMLESGAFNKTDTECQKQLNLILEELNIEYVNEKGYDGIYSVDNYLLNEDLIIEVMGEFWHCDNRKYSKIQYKNQLDRIIRDKAKHNYFKNKYNINILYLWECDIIENKKLCEELIKTYVNNKGIISNYHSMNYELNDSLQIKENIIIPYMDWNMEELNNMVDYKIKDNISRKDPKKWIKFKCENCGKEREELISHYKKYKHHYCSIKCSSGRNSVEVKCNNCGKTFRIGKQIYENSKTKKFICSKQCKKTNLQT